MKKERKLEFMKRERHPSMLNQKTFSRQKITLMKGAAETLLSPKGSKIPTLVRGLPLDRETKAPILLFMHG